MVSMKNESNDGDGNSACRGDDIYPDIYKEINSAVHFLKFKAIKQIIYGFNNII